MIGVEATREKMENRYRRRFSQWAVGGETEPAASVPLHPPTEAVVLQRGDEVLAWVRDWRAAEHGLSRGAQLHWEARRWANAGANRVPVRLELPTPDDVAHFAGRIVHWATARDRAAELLELLGAEESRDAVRRRLADVAALDEEEYGRLRDVLTWLVANPDAGLFPRQIPVRGVHSKWLESHRRLVLPLVSSVTGRADLGLRGLPQTLRLRVLDPALAPAGLRDLTVPVEELARWQVAPRRAIVVENLQSLLGLPDMGQVVAVHNPGSTGAPLLDQLPWLHAADLIYWGDLDVEGLRILSRVRGRLPHTRSVLTDRATLTAHLDLTVPDHRNAPRTPPDHLTDVERDLFSALREFGDVRLEQERIPWERAVDALRRAASEEP
ncbi:Wadjet anti-phage system protein JetD domain-containing protein [Nesterenkonia sp. K-15-9-6]|uniref:Wadjet anti-phage system protein JetD domain-containing protein n=1 Tax=Nesterenkonia sp. K-15-9-6 TaxID=3093918 RepID=UPI0040450189